MTEQPAYERTDLSDLVRDRKNHLGLSYHSLAALCIDPEAKDEDSAPLWTSSTLENLVKQRKIKAPDFPMVRALAAALEVPLRDVQEAAGAQFLGIDTVWSPDGKVRALVDGFREMDEDDKAKVLALMEAWRTLKRE
ncbi:XRE family transcriptional regulator [Streptomyces sp. NPDC054940]